jgi:arylsulfatase A-like enzyme
MRTDLVGTRRNGTVRPGVDRNVLLVVTDTVRKDRLGPYGHDRGTTPRLSAFAEGAMVFDEAVAPAPWTLPVHASLFTGTYPSEHGATQESPHLDGGRTLAETLSEAGYDTACYTSNAWITPYTGMTRGFDEQDNFFEVMPGDLLSGPLARAWRALNERPALRQLADRLVELGNAIHERTAGGSGADSKTPRVIDRTLDFVDRSDGPFFAFLNLMDAHLPYYPPDEYRERFAPGVDPDAVCQNSKEYNCGARDVDEAEWEAIRRLYDAEIAHADAEIGRLLDGLGERGLREDTLVVVCADHGELHGEHGLYGHEFCIYDPLVNVPLLIDGPGFGTGRRDDQVELLDLYHTILDCTGDATDDGRSFDPARSLVRDDYRSFDGAEYAFVEYARPVVELNQLESKAAAAGIELDPESRFYSRMRAVRTPERKYIENERRPDECYRLDVDPGETDPVDDDGCSEFAAELVAFTDRVGADWSSESDGDVLGDMDEAAVDRLRDLGYVE